MKKSIRWVIVILALSGWIATGIIYVYFQNRQAKMETDIVTLQAEIQAYRFLGDDIEKSIKEIEGIISNLESIKGGLQNVKTIMNKGEIKN